MKDEDQESAKIFELCVKKIQIRSERKFDRILDFDLKWFCYSVKIRVSLFICLANDHANPLFHVLIMISEY
jgi:hypothetical protein